MNVLITGGTGFIGRALISRLHSDGHSVTVLVRNITAARMKIGEAVSLELISISDAELDSVMTEADAVVNLAGEPIIGKRWTVSQKELIRSSRVGLTKRLVDSMLRCTDPPGVFLSSSAVGYYGDNGDHELIEASPGGRGFLAELCMDWEKAALRAESGGVRVVVSRIGVVLGLGGGALSKMLTPFRLGLGGPVGSGKQYVAWIHIDDLVELLTTALADPQFSGPVNTVGPAPVPFKQFAKSLGQALNRPAVLPVPSFVLRLIFGEASETILTSQRAVPARALENEFTFSYNELTAALDDIINRPRVS